MLEVDTLLPPSFTPDKQEEIFGEILRLYDLSDEIMAAVAQEGMANQQLQLELAKPYVMEITNTANNLAAFYTDVMRGGRPVTHELQNTFENIFQKFFDSLHDIVNSMEERLLPEENK